MYGRKRFNRRRNFKRKKFTPGRYFKRRRFTRKSKRFSRTKTMSVKLYENPVIRSVQIGTGLSWPDITSMDTVDLGRVAPYLTRYTNMFEYYRINKVVCKINWSAHAGSPPYNATDIPESLLIPTLAVSIDHDGGSIPVNLAGVLQYANAKRFVLNKPNVASFAFTPSILSRSYETVTSDAFTPKFKQWIDTNDYTTPHYGLRWATSVPVAAVSALLGRLDFVYTYYVSFKGLKANADT